MSGSRWGITLILMTVGVLQTLTGSAGASALPGPSGEAPRRTCGPDAATTLVAGRLGRVYELPVLAEDGKHKEHIMFACLFGLSRPWRLDRISSETGGFPVLDSSMIVFHAPWVAYSADFWRTDTGDLYVAAMNLRSGRSHLCPVGSWSSSEGVRSDLAGIALTRTGSVGWIAQRREVSVIHGEVGACDSAGFRTLDAGDGIDLDSLRLRKSRLSWTDSGAERATVLH